ncbi:MAG: sigma-54-dependent Fis family transcriptional regulator [Gemmatimonadota bacterium]|nr:MAG: sigma-54-dependent Fis family transcriptional regulator [Gemmatimonadota bacterium]
MGSILVIDDDESFIRVLEHMLIEDGHRVATASDGERGLKIFKGGSFDIVLTDLMMPKLDGMAVLKEVRRIDREAIVIFITAHGTVENAVEACRLGATDYITKPFSHEQLSFVVEKAIKVRELLSENIRLQTELSEKYQFKNIVGRSARMEEVFRLAGQVAGSDATVLLLGESGTGKELIARAIHFNSPREKRRFMAINCASIPDNLMESELFGHVKGAFTGAMKDKKGKFELADGGTIFLDEVADLKSDLQAKLLRFLQEREFEPVGATEPIRVDVRIIAATNKDLEKLIREEKFREDLYYRLSVVPVVLPPLRARKDDIPLLVDHFLRKYGGEKSFTVADDAMKILYEFDWPGNVRELENVVERAVVLAGGGVITSDLLPSSLRTGRFEGKEFEVTTEGLSMAEVERQTLLAALERTGWNKTKAAESLEIPRHVLMYKMKKLGLQG